MQLRACIIGSVGALAMSAMTIAAQAAPTGGTAPLRRPPPAGGVMASVVARTDIACMATRNIIAPARAVGGPRWTARDAAAAAGADASRESAKLRSRAEFR